MMRAIDAALERRATVYVACAASLVLGLFFIFIWTPLPWGWKGIDGYDAISVNLAHGAPFPDRCIWCGATPTFSPSSTGCSAIIRPIGLSAQALFNARSR
jgi:hypothetical protein